MKCCNHGKIEELGWKSSFEIYYGRKPSKLLSHCKSHDNDIHFSDTVEPSKQEFEIQQNFTRQWRKATMKADERMRKIMLEKDARKNTYKPYKPVKNIFIHLSGKVKDSLKKYRVLIGRALKVFNRKE